MNTKVFLMLLLTLLASLALVSAQVTLSQPASLSKAVTATSFTITNPATSGTSYDVSISPITITDSKGNNILVNSNPSSISNLIAGASQTINLSYSILPSGLTLSPNAGYQGTITVTAINSTGGSAVSTTQISFVNSFCNSGDIGDTLQITRVRDNKLDNSDEWTWNPLDNIEISVKVHNSGEKDLDVTLEYGLYEPFSNSFIDIDEDTIDISVDHGSTSDEELITFQIPSDIDEGSDYRFYVKAYKDGNEKTNCTDLNDEDDYFKEVDIQKETRAIILTETKIDSSVLCGDTVELKTQVSNVGNEDEKAVLVTIFNKELGIDIKKVIDKLNSGDDKTITLDFTIPQNKTEKTYILSIDTYFKYDSGCSDKEDFTCYDKSASSDLDRNFDQALKVEGNCAPIITTPQTQITAVLDSDAIAGQDIIVKATIKNTGSSDTTYTVLASGYENFATLSSINPQTFTLAASQSKDVLITLKANSDAAGDYTFDIKALSGSQVKQQSLSLTIEGKSSLFTGSSILNSLSANLSGNWFIWVIVLVNVVLIVLIIIIAIRIARK